MSKEEILKFFEEKMHNKCEGCPLKKECDNTYYLTRRSSTNAITICDALKMDDNKLEIYIW